MTATTVKWLTCAGLVALAAVGSVADPLPGERTVSTGPATEPAGQAPPIRGILTRILTGFRQAETGAAGRRPTVAATSQAGSRPAAAGMLAVNAPTLTDSAHLTGTAKAYWEAEVIPAGRTQAIQEARRDALRRIAERLGRVSIMPEVTAGELLDWSDEPKVDRATLLPAARATGIRYRPDEPVVEVRMRVTLRSALAGLLCWGRLHYHGDKSVMAAMEKIIVEAPDEIIEEVGAGRVPPEYLRGAEGHSGVKAQKPEGKSGRGGASSGSSGSPAR